ncbi:MAG: terminase gpA endonuclease subunit [Hyphomicrobiales bacterium]|nr:terminase gpA endonuclease subunit [Hyphomicrobiales bacterium]
MWTDEWARAHRVLPATAGRPGPFDPDFTPYMRDFARAFDDGRYKKVVLVCGSQMSKTETALNVMGSRLDQRPCPMIYVGPTKDFNNDQLEPRFMDLVEQSASLRDKLARGKKSKKSRKVVSGVPVLFAWAGSSTPLKSTPAGLVLVDERDGMEASVQGEGDPVELVEARGDTYADFKLGVTSTPTEGNVETEIDEASQLERWRLADKEQVQSPIWRLWQEGTRHEWAWPCPHCGEYFVPRFKHLSFPEKADPVKAGAAAHLVCPTCGCEITDEHKAAMNAAGVYVAPGQTVAKDGTVTGQPPETNTVSFWVSGLCSPFQTFSKRVTRYVEALQTGDAERVKAVVNTGFGELFSIGGGEVADWREVAALREDYGAREVPVGAILITCGIDVQGDRLVYATRGWGARFESWLIEHGEIFGETDKDQVWGDLELYLSRRIEGEPIARAMIDTGYRPGRKIAVPVNRVYEFCSRVASARACKGRDTLDKRFYASRIEVDLRGKAKKTGLTLWHLNTDYFKKWVHGRLHWPTDQPGRWFLHRDATEDYCKQIVSEVRIVRPSGRPEWKKIRQANHYFDCEYLNAAAAHMERVDLIPDGASRAVESQATGAPAQAQSVAQTQTMIAAAVERRSIASYAQRLNRR